MNNLWEQVAMKCLRNAKKLLDSNTHESIVDAGRLVEIALKIDAADREWKGNVDISPERRMLLGLQKKTSK